MKAQTTEDRGQTPEAGQAVSMIFAERSKDIAEFCLERGGKAFANWPVPTLFAYIFFHLVDGTCFVVRKQGAIAAVLFAQLMPEAEIRRRAAEGKSFFNWRCNFKGADAIALAEVVGQRQLLPRLAKKLAQRWPDWKQRKVFTFRAGELVELPPDLIERFLAA